MAEFTWKGGEHCFALKIEHLRALQNKCDAGPAWILHRLKTHQWLVDDIIQTIRLGLEGGGASKEEARKLVERYVESEPLNISVLTAYQILLEALNGDEGDPVGESDAGETDPLTQGAKSNGPGFTEPVQ